MTSPLLQPEGEFPAAGLGRRLAAMAYDLLLCVALLIITTLLYKLVAMAILGEPRLRQLSDAGKMDGDPLLSTLLVFVLFGFFATFWTRAGQTLGMQVWHIRVQNTDGSAIGLWQALLRFLVSTASWLCLGTGFLWILLDRQGRSWQDIYSRSSIVRLPPRR